MDEITRIQTSNRVIRHKLADLDVEKKRIEREQVSLNKKLEETQRVFDTTRKKQEAEKQRPIKKLKREIVDFNKKKEEFDRSFEEIRQTLLREEEEKRRIEKQRQQIERQLKILDTQIRRGESLLKQKEGNRQRGHKRAKERFNIEIRQKRNQFDQSERKLKEIEKKIEIQKSRLRQGLSQFRQAMENKARQKVKRPNKGLAYGKV